VFIDLYSTLYTPLRDSDNFESLSAAVCLCGEISHPSISLNKICVLWNFLSTQEKHSHWRLEQSRHHPTRRTFTNVRCGIVPPENKRGFRPNKDSWWLTPLLQRNKSPVLITMGQEALSWIHCTLNRTKLRQGKQMDDKMDRYRKGLRRAWRAAMGANRVVALSRCIKTD
jgi:hypothetical protein